MNTNTNTKAFFELVRAGLWEKEVRLSNYENIDFAEVYRLAEEQSVIGMVAAGIDHVVDVKVPQVWALQFAGQTIQLEQRNKEMNAYIAGLIDKLRKENVYALLVKGQGVAQCYEKPLWRCPGDIDLFLSDENFQRAKSYLLPLASSVEEEYVREKHLGLTIDGWVVELHGHLYSGLSSRVERELDKLQEDTFYGGQVRSWMNGQTQIMKFILKSGNMGHNRDMSHFSKYPYLIRKCVSMGRRISDLINHARVFPLDSLRFFLRIMFNGVRSAIKGE